MFGLELVHRCVAEKRMGSLDHGPFLRDEAGLGEFAAATSQEIPVCRASEKPQDADRLAGFWREATNSSSYSEAKAGRGSAVLRKMLDQERVAPGRMSNPIEVLIVKVRDQ